MIIIFTEALANCGLGHLGRCTALAEKLIEQGNNSVQIVLYSNLALTNWKYPCSVIRLNWLDLENLKKILSELKSKSKGLICYVDSYLATIDIYQSLKGTVSKLICIDDDKRLNYPTGATILNPGFPGLFIDYDKKSYEVITGKKEVLLRKPFRENFDIPKRNKPPRNILIALGSAKAGDFFIQIMKLLLDKFSHLEKNIISAEKSVYFNNLSKDSKTKIFAGLSAVEMRDLMLNADFAITAGGQTTYELDRCKVPMVIVKTAENQSGNIRGFVELQGTPKIDSPGDIIKYLT